jgi:hypothetical protein
MTSGQDPGPPPDHADAETYLRLRAEAELRRVQALPRPDPLEAIGVPAPLRGAVRLALPLGRLVVTTVQPLAGSAGQALQPLAERATHTLQPLAENAARAVRPLAEDASRNLQPVADAAARTIQPLTSQLADAVLPVAEETARRLNPLVRRAAGQLQTSAASQFRTWRRQARRVTSPLTRSYQVTTDGLTARRFTSGRPPERAKLSPMDGVRRLGTVAQALTLVGEIDHGTADAIMASVETALVVRSRLPPHRIWLRARRARAQQEPVRPPAGAYIAAPVGALVVTESDSGPQHAHLVTIVIAPDRALLTLAGWVDIPEDRSVHGDPWPVFGGSGQPTARDDRGNSYTLREDSGWSNGDGEWNRTMRLSPVPPAGARWLELTMSPGAAPIRVDLAGVSGAATAAPRPGGSAAERLIDAMSMNLLYAAAGGGGDDAPGLDLSQAAAIVTALEAVGAVEPARDAVSRLVALAGRIGVDVPPALRAAAVPRDLPAAWASVLENSHCLDGPRGMTPAAAVLPELDGARFVLAGLRSDLAGAKLFALVWGRHGMFSLPHYAVVSPWSWSARDDRGRWHVMGRGAYSGRADHAEVELHLKPPLHPLATSLEVTLTGPSGQVTATVPLDWRQP